MKSKGARICDLGSMQKEPERTANRDSGGWSPHLKWSRSRYRKPVAEHRGRHGTERWSAGRAFWFVSIALNPWLVLREPTAVMICIDMSNLRISKTKMLRVLAESYLWCGGWLAGVKWFTYGLRPRLKKYNRQSVDKKVSICIKTMIYSTKNRAGVRRLYIVLLGS